MTLTELVRARRSQLEHLAGHPLADPEWAQVERRTVTRIEQRIAAIQDMGSRPITIESETATICFRLELLPLIQ